MSRARRIRIPEPLDNGARIAVIAPGSSVNRSAVRAGMAQLKTWGYQPVAGPNLFRRAGDLAGADAGRLDDLLWAFDDRGIDAVWAARGGWGSARLFDALPRSFARGSRRWLLGFSDITALQAVLLERGLASWYAPLVGELTNEKRYSRAALMRALHAPHELREFTVGARGCVVRGTGQGPLTGGCLTLLATLAGTPWQPDLRKSIVFVEEVAEAPYRIDRMLWQLRASGMLDAIAGLVYGQFVNCKPVKGRPSRSLGVVLREHAQALGVPCLKGIPCGHGPRMRPLPLGYTARVDARRGLLSVHP